MGKQQKRFKKLTMTKFFKKKCGSGRAGRICRRQKATLLRKIASRIAGKVKSIRSRRSRSSSSSRGKRTRRRRPRRRRRRRSKRTCKSCKRHLQKFKVFNERYKRWYAN